jgi:transcriptional regulator with XRE-family HTH domain
MNSIGETIRNLRLEKQLPLRTVAAFLDIDQAILSRIERGERKANREQIVKLAQYFNVPENDLLITWLADKVTATVADEKEIANKVLNIAKKQINN